MFIQILFRPFLKMCPSFIQQHGGKNEQCTVVHKHFFGGIKHIFALCEQGLRFENEVAFHDITFVVLYGIA